ncbi:glycosyltransferase family 2 protein [Chryseobacterium lathyri]|uniref:GT2 family glycosyltransferase n=1 Tax=Chryseobacterium lathyri TaxID=395933 RepID=A0ABT9SG65_9FLAO|nr:glycosyltransferase family 2 protein [Chryseobacterium lathyri]MDP9958414.1 GT2 family glycosyltransferase [Chryseobacterium lathyri]
MKIYFIIVTYNAMKWAERCFTSLRNSHIPVKSIVIDNGSTDGTQEYVKTQFPEVDFIQSAENSGFGKANNQGIEKAYKGGADFVYLMNQDAWIFPDSVEQLLEVYKNYPNQEQIGILSPMHMDGSGKRFDLHFENYIAQDCKNNRLLSDVFLGEVKPFYEIKFVNAAHWFIPRNVLEKVGGFNPYFFHGAEDYDYINRVTYFGLKVIVCPKSKVVHDAKVQSFQEEEKKDPAEVLARKRLSMQMQRETRYMNPNFDYNIGREKKAFITSLMKHGIQRNTSEYKFYLGQYKFFSKRFDEIEAYRKLSMSGNHPYLNI